MRLSLGRLSITLLAALSGSAIQSPVLAAQQPDALTQLGTNTTAAHESFISSLTSGSIFLIGQRSVFRTAPPELRAALVRGVIAAARAYTGSADFATRYATFRDGQKPQQEQVAQSGDAAQADAAQQLEASIREMQKSAAGFSPEMRKQVEQQIAEMRKQMREAATDPDTKAARDRAAPEMAKAADAQYQERLALWAAEYPADPGALIARRLRAFLDLSATVDFTATLVARPDKRMRFADPALEQQPPEWKLLFRAGKPAVDAARLAAEDWLKAIAG